MRKGNLFVLTGPSGAGKGTVLAQLMAQDENLFLSVSGTTRKPRPGEIDGKHYFFLTKEAFEDNIKAGALLEHARYVEHYYGTPKAPVEENLAQGRDVILEIEVLGAEQVKRAKDDAVLIFIAPPSIEVLEQRLRGRGTESEDSIQKRIETAKGELAKKDTFDHIVVNDTVEQAVRDVQNIIINYRKHAK